MRVWARSLALAAIVLVAAFCCSSTAVRADKVPEEVYAPATLTVPALFALVRSAGGSLEPGAYHELTRTQSAKNADYWTSDRYSDGVDYRSTVQHGAFVSSYGSYKGQQWRQNANGFVALTTGYEEEADPFRVSLSKPEDPGSNVKLLGLTTGSAPSYVVEVTPRTGLVGRMYYDAKTYRLTELREDDYDGHHRSAVYGDYRTVAGRTMPYSIDHSLDGVLQTQTKVTTFERVAPASVQLAIPESKPLFAIHAGDAVDVPADFTPYGIVIRVTIGGRGLDFLLDTGASTILIDPGVANELGMLTSGAERMSFGGDFEMSNTRAPDFSVAGLQATNVALAAAHFDRNIPGKRIVGLLGADFVASGALEVNYEKHTVTLRSSVPADLKAQGWAAVPIRIDQDVPLIQANFSGIDGYFIVDLGAVMTTLYPHYFARFNVPVPPGVHDQGHLVFIGGKAFGYKHVTMKQLTLGDWNFGGVQVVVPSAGYAQDLDYDGLIGRTTLSNFNMIFDYKNRQLWIKPLL